MRYKKENVWADGGEFEGVFRGKKYCILSAYQVVALVRSVSLTY